MSARFRGMSCTRFCSRPVNRYLEAHAAKSDNESRRLIAGSRFSNAFLPAMHAMYTGGDLVCQQHSQSTFVSSAGEARAWVGLDCGVQGQTPAVL